MQKKVFPISMKFVMQIELDDHVLYEPIQGRGQGHEWLKTTQEESTVSPVWD